MTDIAANLRLKSASLRELGSTVYNQKLREIIWETAYQFREAAAEIEELRREIRPLKANTPQ